MASPTSQVVSWSKKKSPRPNIWFPCLIWGILLLTFLKGEKKNHTNISQAIPPPESQSHHENIATQVWLVTQTASHETFFRSFSGQFVQCYSPVRMTEKNVDTSTVHICSQCVHSNSDVCGFKHLFNHCRYIFPLQAIKTTSNPEKDKTAPQAVVKVPRKSFLSSSFRLHPLKA